MPSSTAFLEEGPLGVERMPLKKVLSMRVSPSAQAVLL